MLADFKPNDFIAIVISFARDDDSVGYAQKQRNCQKGLHAYKCFFTSRNHQLDSGVGAIICITKAIIYQSCNSRSLFQSLQRSPRGVGAKKSASGDRLQRAVVRS